MTTHDPIRFKAATAVFKLGLKTQTSGVHRTLNREPTGKGWAQCINAPAGLLCKPQKMKEAIAYFKIAYEISPEIVALNQLALSYEMLGDFENATCYFEKMKLQAENEGNQVYAQTAGLGIARCSEPV